MHANGQQLTLDEACKPVRNALEERYRTWIEANPEVMELFRRFAVEALRQGRRFWVKLLAERVRWEMRMTWRQDRQGFKMNNSHTAYLARDLLREMPALERLIETRRVKGEEDGADDKADC